MLYALISSETAKRFGLLHAPDDVWALKARTDKAFNVILVASWTLIKLAETLVFEF